MTRGSLALTCQKLHYLTAAAIEASVTDSTKAKRIKNGAKVRAAVVVVTDGGGPGTPAVAYSLYRR